MTFSRRSECRGLSKILLQGGLWSSWLCPKVHFMQGTSFLPWLIIFERESERNCMNKERWWSIHCTAGPFIEEILFHMIIIFTSTCSLSFWVFVYVSLWNIWPFCDVDVPWVPYRMMATLGNWGSFFSLCQFITTFCPKPHESTVSYWLQMMIFFDHYIQRNSSFCWYIINLNIQEQSDSWNKMCKSFFR